MRLAGAFGVLVTGLVLAGAAQAQSEERELPALAPAPDDALTDALESGQLSEAEYALERAQSLFRLGKIRREFGDVERAGPRDATLILRDLAVRTRQLTGVDRSVAREILARPDFGGVPAGTGAPWTAPPVDRRFICGNHVCVHWVVSTSDAPDLTTTLEPGLPDYVLRVLQIWDQEAWEAEIDVRGYRSPLSDSSSTNHGPDGKLDVYLQDLGDDGLFGYCVTDDPNPMALDTVSAYCVVDNDFSSTQFGAPYGPDSWEKFLEVTSAHEFHHSSQFAYDFLEDYWLMEGTATNMEEEVYPEVSDNVTFLTLYSPLSRPSSPLDRGFFGDSEYGSWIFFRFLQEKIGDSAEPWGIIREIWERAGRAPYTTWYSLQAVKTELAQNGRTFPDVFAQFGRTNRRLAYADDAIARYPRVPLTWMRAIGRKSPKTSLRSWKIDHLATRYFTFTPGKRVSPKARLAIRVLLPKKGTSSMRVSVMIARTDNSTGVRVLKGKNGVARTTTPFNRAGVKRVDVVLSNGSTRTTCWQGVGPPFYSCEGTPSDDRRVFKLSAALR
jgi:hypothetical protein